MALLGPLALARARHPLCPPSSPRFSPARLPTTLSLSYTLYISASLASAAVDVFEAIEISTYPSSATKCEEFSIRVPSLNPPRDRPLTVQTIHILLFYPSLLVLCVLPHPRSLQSPRPTFSTCRTLQRTRGKRKDDNADVAGVTELRNVLCAYFRDVRRFRTAWKHVMRVPSDAFAAIREDEQDEFSESSKLLNAVAFGLGDDS